MPSPSTENVDDDVVESSASNTKPDASFQPFSKAERIKQLNDIDKSIAKMLQSAGLALKTLTRYQTDSNTLEDSPLSFSDATNTYLEDLHSVDVRLKRQIYGLHEAGIIAMAKEPSTRLDSQHTDASRISGDNVALDVGWLNSRSGKVGRDMEAELWTKARTFLEALEAQKENGRDHNTSQPGVEDQEMEI